MDDREGVRRYDSLRRRAQARETRAEIAEAARRLFLARGWAATTVSDVAREAGVSTPTVYSAYGNKTGLAWALIHAADLSAEPSRMLADLESSPTPAGQLAAMAGYDRRLFERAGDLITLIRDAARTEPDFADLYRHARHAADQTRIDVFSSWPPSTLRPDLTTAVDIYAALCNIDAYTTLTLERSWHPDRVQQWWSDTLTRELLDS
ncbi:TetR/AcrR family transcriptional regulator [Nocardia sp. NPDC006044]|uniref:TetR/AcrR family transcriptional regulator n=1 Tax=Nocardia sp. NPDC006044 TaxID=3364306 RepID=UPI0036A181EA